MIRASFLYLFIILIFSLHVLPLHSQERPLNTGLSNDEEYAFIGMTLSEMLERFGPPRSVASARGIELWQDDVVFHYTGVDFYVFKDRVWQVKFATTRGISVGDRKEAVLLTLGSAAEDRGDFLLLPITGANARIMWPLFIRINFTNTGLVNAIFLYRPDFQ